jgi:molecular chaperone DnaJ
VRLALDQAILGTVADVATLTGKASVKIPPGTSSGVKLRLKGKGARGAGGQLGDHLVTIQIDVPKQLDDDAKALLVQLMQRTRGGVR